MNGQNSLEYKTLLALLIGLSNFALVHLQNRFRNQCMLLASEFVVKAYSTDHFLRKIPCCSHFMR